MNQETDPATSDQPAKRCKICGNSKSISEFAANPHAKDGFNSVCSSCRGRSGYTRRGKERLASEAAAEAEALVDSKAFFEMLKTGDRQRDLFLKYYCRLAVGARNEQTQLAALNKLAEFVGADKEPDKDQKDFIHAAFMRMKEQKDSQPQQ